MFCNRMIVVDGNIFDQCLFHRLTSPALVEIEVFSLFFTECIDGIAHGAELDCCDFLIDFMGQYVDVIP